MADGSVNGSSVIGWDVHPYAEDFPLTDVERVKEIAADILRCGLREPIVLYEGRVLDGRTRLSACGLAHVEPTFVEFSGTDGEALDLALSSNAMRRDMSPAQRVAALLKNRRRSEAFRIGAIQRQIEGGRRGGNKAGRGRPAAGLAPIGAEANRNGSSNGVPQESTLWKAAGKAAAAIAKTTGASTRTVERVLRVQREDPEQFEKVWQGEQTVSAAERIIQQREVAERPQSALPEGTYDVIYAAHPTKSSPFAPLAAENCVLFLRTPPSKLDKAFEVMDENGFRFVSVWTKGGVEAGSWFELQHQLLLLATRGEISPSKEALSKALTRAVAEQTGVGTNGDQFRYWRLDDDGEEHQALDGGGKPESVGETSVPKFAERVRGAWGKDTSFTPREWSIANPAWGQCVPSAILVNRRYGGQIIGVNVIQDGQTYRHYYNQLPSGTIVDLTREQFDGAAEYVGTRPKTRPFGVDALRRADLLEQRMDARASHFTVATITRRQAVPFLKRWHYSGSASTGQYIGLVDDGERLAGVACIKGLSGGNDKSRSRFNVEGLTVRELSRLALRDDCPKNSESVFLRKMFSLLREQGVDLMLAYADPAYGHMGTIYQATNWLYFGPSTGSACNDRYVVDGKPVSSSGLRKLSPTQKGREQALREMYGDRLQVFPRSRKHVYLNPLTHKAHKAVAARFPVRAYPKGRDVSEFAQGCDDGSGDKAAA